jgi:hypothetical protein
MKARALHWGREASRTERPSQELSALRKTRRDQLLQGVLCLIATRPLGGQPKGLTGPNTASSAVKRFNQNGNLHDPAFRFQCISQIFQLYYNG